MYIKLSTFLLIGLLLFFVTGKIYASSMSNSEYRLETGDFNTSSGTTTTPGSNQQSTVINTNQAKSYSIEPGLPSNTAGAVLRITTSSDFIDFGKVTPGEPILRDLKVTLRNQYLSSYFVIGSQDHNLSSSEKQEIPDTTCDNGSCSETVADAWIIPLTYGFGYTCKEIINKACLTDIIDSGFYKQFANLEKKEQGQFIMKGTNSTDETTLTFKINLSSSQKPGSYSNSVTLIGATSY